MKLIEHIKILVSEERKITAELLYLLLQIEESKTYAELGYSSLFEFCIKELGYSEGAAYRRVSAMRLLKREKSCADKIASGELSLSNAAKVETIFRQAKKHQILITKTQQAELFQAALGTSSRDAEKKLSVLAEECLGIPLPRQSSALPTAIEEKLGKLQALLSHKYPHANKEELLHILLDEAIDRVSKTQGNIAAEVHSPEKRFIPAKLRAAILKRDQGQCTYHNLQTGRRCQSKHFLEIDHIQPVALGGKTEPGNLRILCRAHNLLEAEKAGLGRVPRSKRPTG